MILVSTVHLKSNMEKNNSCNYCQGHCYYHGDLAYDFLACSQNQAFHTKNALAVAREQLMQRLLGPIGPHQVFDMKSALSVPIPEASIRVGSEGTMQRILLALQIAAFHTRNTHFRCTGTTHAMTF